jgi:hypothetical protein
VCACRDYERRR